MVSIINIKILLLLSIIVFCLIFACVESEHLTNFSKNDTFVHCEYMGGLGNQLFIIWTAIAYSLDNNISLSLDIKDKSPGITDRNTYFNNLLINLKDTKNKTLINENINIHQEYDARTYKNIPRKTKIIIKGYFQSYKYFDHRKNDIIKLLNIDKQQNIIKIKYDYNFNNSLSIHFRIGDYNSLDIHPILNIEYYKKSLKYLQNNNTLIDNIFVFCQNEDRIQVDKMMNLLNIKYTIIDNKIPDYEQLILMSLCSNNIIANSTYSWWGAYLNSNENKIVIYPNTHQIKGKRWTDDNMFNSWIKI